MFDGFFSFNLGHCFSLAMSGKNVTVLVLGSFLVCLLNLPLSS